MEACDYLFDPEREAPSPLLTPRRHAVKTNLRGLVMQLSDEVVGGGLRSETLREIGEQLEAHVRLEDRVVFPARRAVGPRRGTLLRTLAGPGDSEGGGYD